MNVPDDLLYTKDHEWVRLDDARSRAVVGITDHAQDALGDVVHVELPEPGQAISAGDAVGEVESVKAVSDVYAPLSGTVERVNEDLEGSEDAVNTDPYGAGWMFELSLADAGELDGLMDAEAYRAYLAAQQGDH